MTDLRSLIVDAEKQKVALGHFNISDSEQLWGIFNAARALNVPILVGTSEGERDFFGPRQAAAVVKSIREQYDYPIFLNADHTYSVERSKEAVDAGYDEVIIDGTKVGFEENVAMTKEVVEYARKTRPEVLIEGEIGFIGTSSKLLDAIPVGAQITEETLTKPDEAARFVKETGVDLLAPAVGNLHGMLKSGLEPALNIKRIKDIREAAGVPLVLHGGSGTSDDDFVNAIKAGISIVHINTEIRIAYRKGIQLSLSEDPEEIAPYKFMKGGVQAVTKVVSDRLKLFNGR